MGRSKRSSVQKYHDRVAGKYDHSYDDVFWQWHDALTWDYLKPYIPTDQSSEVLDLGCGTGKWGLKLLKSGFRVTFVDISPKMIDQARANTEKSNGRSRASFVRADICDLSELPSAQFAFILAMGDPICCATPPAKAMSEIRRVITPNGVLSATFDNRLAAIDYYMDRGNSAEMKQFLRDGRTHWLTRNPDEQFPTTTYTPNDLQKLMANAGFEIIDQVGKTILPMRRHRHLLEDSKKRAAWTRIEKTLCRDVAAIGRASHIQLACKPC